MSTYLSYDPSTTVPLPKARLRKTNDKQPQDKQRSGEQPIQQGDGNVVETIPVPDILTPLTSTFTTHFDLTKGAASHSSTSMSMGKERRASMEGLDERPKFSHATDVPVLDVNDESICDDDDGNDTEEKQANKSRSRTAPSDKSFREYFPALTSNLVANCVIGLVGIFIIYKVIEARSRPA